MKKPKAAAKDEELLLQERPEGEPRAPESGPRVASGADRVKAIGEAAQRMAEAYATRQTDQHRRRILADFEVRRSHNRHIRRHLFEMARRFEDYASPYDCARELRDFVESMGGPIREQLRKNPYKR